MDRDTLQDDLDLILGPSRDAQLPGAWDWEPPLGTVATEPTEPEETETETAGDPEDGATDDDEQDD
jgi:hypothetical protein